MCRLQKKRAKLSSHVIGKLSVHRLKPAPPWTSVGIDLFGPFGGTWVRGGGGGNRRSTSKAYGVIFFCLPSTAVLLDITTDYSTDAFLMVLPKFVSLRGYPSNIYSDPGSQLVGASNVLKRTSKNWDWDNILDFGVSKGMPWNFSPGDSPWRNGCCESLIKSKNCRLILEKKLCYFPNLIIQQNWHHKRRNVQVGDIVIIADQHLNTEGGGGGGWKLRRVSEVVPGEDGYVRRVAIQYKTKMVIHS